MTNKCTLTFAEVNRLYTITNTISGNLLRTCNRSWGLPETNICGNTICTISGDKVTTTSSDIPTVNTKQLSESINAGNKTITDCLSEFTSEDLAVFNTNHKNPIHDTYTKLRDKRQEMDKTMEFVVKGQESEKDRNLNDTFAPIALAGVVGSLLIYTFIRSQI